MGKARWYGSINNRLEEGRPSLTPEVGMGGTVMMWSDRNPVTVSRIISRTRIAVTPDRVTEWDGEYGKAFETVPGAEERIVRLCSDGKWKFEKDAARTVVVLGTRQAYYDRSF